MNDTYLTILNSYGDIVELDYQFDVPSIIDELKSVDNWIDGTNNKKGLTLTGSVDDLELTKRNDSSINDNLKKFLEIEGFDLDFEKCLKNQEIEDFVLNDRIEGAKNFKINATPTIIINNKKFEKSLNFKNLKKSLEKLI